MVLRALDPRLRPLLEHSIACGHRSLVVLVGDESRLQLPLLHHMVSQTRLHRPSVLWCFKKDLGFSSARAEGNKRMKAWQKKKQKQGNPKGRMESGPGPGPGPGQEQGAEQEAFQMFLAATTIRYCYYKETHRILGQTFGMCILQDFEALTPNLLARTIETVEGGGLIVLLLKSVNSLKQLYTMNMDVHARFRTESQHDVTARFNERFLLSLSSLQSCLFMNESLEVLPVSSSRTKLVTTTTKLAELEEESLAQTSSKLKELKLKFADSHPTGNLVNLCKTYDQARALLEFIDAITDKKLDRTVSLTAGRGRGKSATQGLAIAAAVGFGYTNIFVTSPSPENLHTLFEFVFKGFDAMEYEEHSDYDIIQSTQMNFNNAVVRVNIHERNMHRQTIQYIHPSDAQQLGQAELLIIDEAGAIPLPLVQNLLGPYLVFLSSTINGYEGTGRSLSLKLISQLRKQNTEAATSNAKKGAPPVLRRTLREVTLNESIRYRNGDPIEMWLHKLLCLDVSTIPMLPSRTLNPNDCELFYINRDTLFSYHKASEAFLQRIVSLFVSSHYKNSPNDLQILSDAPAHHLFCLLGPCNDAANNATSLPEVLCAIQVCLEGEVSKQSIMNGLSRGKRASGDLIPWTMAQQFQDDSFPALSGARVVRIATHPAFQRMGFGKRAIQLLEEYYLKSSSVQCELNTIPRSSSLKAPDSGEILLKEEALSPRENLPPLLVRLDERNNEKLDYLGVSYGMTHPLLRFWKSLGFTPTYIRQTASDLTGEHTLIMLKELQRPGEERPSSSWLKSFYADFTKRFINLCNFDMRKFPAKTCLSILSNQIPYEVDGPFHPEVLATAVTPYDQRRLELYSNNMADYHLVMDLVPVLAKLFFTKQLGNLSLSAVQQTILVGIGLQSKAMEPLSEELDLPVSQLLGLFNATMRRLNKHVARQTRSEAAQELALPISTEKRSSYSSLRTEELRGLDDELNSASEEFKRKTKMVNRKRSLADDYRIKGTEGDWKKALHTGGENLVSIKSTEGPNHPKGKK